MRRALVWIACLLAALVVAPPVAAITGGQVDASGKYPHVGALIITLDSGRDVPACSGTLISATVFLTAGHCDPGSNSTVEVIFAPTFDPEATPRYSGTFVPHPDFRQEAYGRVPDLAVVVFEEAPLGHDVTPAQLPTAGLLDDMKAQGALTKSTSFTSVGYGFQEYVSGPGGQTVVTDFSRRFASGSFNSLTRSYLHLSQNANHGDGGTCLADSGGPNFLGAGTTETNIIVGITVTGDTYCKSTNVDFRLDIASARDFLDDFVPLP